MKTAKLQEIKQTKCDAFLQSPDAADALQAMLDGALTDDAKEEMAQDLVRKLNQLDLGEVLNERIQELIQKNRHNQTINRICINDPASSELEAQTFICSYTMV